MRRKGTEEDIGGGEDRGAGWRVATVLIGSETT